MKNIATKIQSVEDARYFAEKRVPKSIFQMFEAGSGSNVTAEDNVKAFESVRFRPRNAVFHKDHDISTTVLGHKLSMPAIVSSVGFLATGHMDGEAGVARAAGAAGTMQFVSGVTGTPIEEIMEAATGPVLYQLYYVGGRDASAPIIQRVKEAGVDGLVLTVDTPTIARPRDLLYPERRAVPTSVNFKNAIKFLPQIWNKPAWVWDFIKAGFPEPVVAMALREDGSPMSLFEGIAEIYKETPKWEDLPWIRKHWDGPIVIKGILTVEDAKRAVKEGVDAIVISNHGGNVLDGSVSTLPVLTEIVEAVGNDIEVLIDSGVRRGTDVLKAVALGAKAALLGRAYLYPLLAAGEQGVRHILDLFKLQIKEGLEFLGVQTLDELDPSFVQLPADWRQPQESVMNISEEVAAKANGELIAREN